MSTMVCGFAYEPSWMANQLNLLYFPLWLGMLVYWESIYKKRLFGIPFEALLLFAGVVAIFLGRSRIGLLGFLCITGFLAVRFAFKVSTTANKRLQKIISMCFPRYGKWVGLFLTFCLWVLIVSLFLGLAVSAIYLAGQLDWRLQRLFRQDVLKTLAANLRNVFSYQVSRALKFAERTAYWTAGFRVFEEHPLMGVGLGNSGFFFLDYIPSYGWRAPEVVQAIRTNSFTFPNPKNLWIRLLAETGIVGFTLFIVWLLVVLMRILQLMSHSDRQYKMLGLVGVLSMIAFVVEGFSVDTFALPYIWVLLGLVSAAARISRSNSECSST